MDLVEPAPSRTGVATRPGDEHGEPGGLLATKASEASTRRSERRDTWKLIAVLIMLTVALRLPAFFVDVFNSDETYLATQAQVIREGGNLYEEAADRKPPLVPYVYAASFELFGTTALWSVRVIAMLAVALTALMIALEARRRYGRRAAWFAGILFVVSMVAFAPQDGQAANFEVFMLPATVAAVLLARRGKGFSAGAAVAVATLAKQTGVATLLPVFYLLARSRGRRGVGDAAAGFAVPTAIVALLVGPGQLLFWTVLGNGSYVGVKTASTYVLSKLLLMTLTWAACNIPILWKLPRAWRDRRARSLDGSTDTDLWLWFLASALMVSIGLRFFGHYYMQVVPPLVLLTTGALGPPQRQTRRDHDRRLRGDVRARVLGGRVLHAAVRPGAELRVGQQVPRGAHERQRQGRGVGERPRDLLGLEPATRDAVRDDDGLPRRRQPGETGDRRRPGRRRPGHVGVVLRGPRRPPAALHRRHVTGPGPGRAVRPHRRVPAPAALPRGPVPLRPLDRQVRHLRAPIAPPGPPPGFDGNVRMADVLLRTREGARAGVGGSGQPRGNPVGSSGVGGVVPADDDEPLLPIKFGPCSNGEYVPRPLTPVLEETVRLAREECDRNARRTGMSRRQFLRSLCGAATTLMVLNACSADESRAVHRRAPGGHFEVPPTADVDIDAARAALAGDEFVFDVQGHLLDYTVSPIGPEGRDFWRGFPQRSCGLADPRGCFDVEHFLQTLFLESDTSMVVLSALPIAPEGSPQSAAVMQETRRLAGAVCGDGRVLLHSQALPNVGDLQANLDAMAAVAADHSIVAWKVFTNYPDLYDGSRNAWRLDDGDPHLPQVGNAFVEQAIKLGVPTICAHKGFSDTAGYRSPHATPVDFGGAAKAHPDARFVAYHSGYEPNQVEGPYDDARRVSA